METKTVMKSVLVGVCILIIVIVLSPSAFAGRKNPLNSTPPEISNSTLCSDQTTDEDLKVKREDFCKLTNSIREWHLTHTLKLDTQLNEIAQLEAKLLFEVADKAASKAAEKNKDVDDDASVKDEEDSGKLSISDVLEKVKEAGLEVGELGFHISTAGLSEAHDVIRKSLSSPTPRKKFLEKSYRKVGIGFYHGVWISLFTD